MHSALNMPHKTTLHYYCITGYYCQEYIRVFGPQIQNFATLKKSPPAEISVIAKFAKQIFGKLYSLENIRIPLFQQKIMRGDLVFTNFAKVWAL